MQENEAGTHTLAEWKTWFAEHRSENIVLRTSLESVPDDANEFERVWLPADRKPPEDVRYYTSWVWTSKSRKTPAPGLSVLTAKGQRPLLLVEPGAELPTASLGRKAKKKQAKQQGRPKGATISPPFDWRCRMCDHEQGSDSTPQHCGRAMRQLASVSEAGTKRFEKFLSDNEWTFLDPEKSDLLKLRGVVNSEQPLEMARLAGVSLEKVLRESEQGVPDRFELYNEQTDRVRVSDLKTKEKFTRIFGNIGKWRAQGMVPVTQLPAGNEEIGHVFDAHLTDILSDSTDSDWGPGKRVQFHSGELGITIGGTPDLMFRNLPVETKTVSFLPHEGKKSQRAAFDRKWHGNYLPQVAMYLEGTDHDWMLLMLVSRKSGLFTLLPIDGSKMNELRKRWKKSLKHDELAAQVAAYRAELAA